MMKNAAKITYSCAPSIQWVKDTYQIVVIDEAANKSFILSDAQAALWSWLSLRYTMSRLVDGLVVLLGVSKPEAETWLRNILDEWSRQGILIATEANENG